MILRQCPVTGGQHLSVTENTFAVACKTMMAQAKAAKKQSGSTRTNTFCIDECLGQRPAELEILTLEEMMSIKKCVGCGRKLTIRGKGLCACCFKKDSLGKDLPLHKKTAVPAPDPSAAVAQQTPPPFSRISSLIDKALDALNIIDITAEDGGPPLCDEEKLLLACKRRMGQIYDLELMVDGAQEEISSLRQELAAYTADEFNEFSMAYYIDAACKEIRNFLLAKNKAYGNSAAEPVRIFSKADPLEQINVRIDDKLSRLIRGTAYPGDDDELDLVGYLLLRRAVKTYQGRNEELAA